MSNVNQTASDESQSLSANFRPLYETSKAIKELDRLEKLFVNTGPVYIMDVRQRFNLTQRSLAKMLGVSACHLSRVENGHEPCATKMMASLWEIIVSEERKQREERQKSFGRLFIAEPGGRVETSVEGERVG